MSILGMTFAAWLVLALLAFSVAVTLVANWLVARRLARPSVGEGVASLVWMVLLFVSGLFAARYAERFAAAYPVYGLVAFLLSLMRAWLYRRSAWPALKVDWPRLVRQLTYLVGAGAAYLALCWLLGHPARPLLFIPLSLGALLPDWPRAMRAENWRTPAAAFSLALVTSPLIILVGAAAWGLLLLGFLCHLALDLLHPPGVRLLWPIRHKHYCFALPPLVVERWLPLGLAVAALLLVWAVDFGPQRAPSTPAPSYEQTVARYYALRGRNRVFARIEGSWQATGRRWSGSFEVLNARGESFLMLDSFTGRIFRAGRSAEDDFYLSSLSLSTGDAIRVKPAEVHLVDEPLAGALPILYQMQREPGLLYTFVSGDVWTDAPLAQDDAPNRLPKIQAGEPGHYTLHYLTAAELIALAGTPVGRADLLIFATYASPASGPTATPLPSPEVGP